MSSRKRPHLDTPTMQPLTPALSPSDGERILRNHSPFEPPNQWARALSLSPLRGGEGWGEGAILSCVLNKVRGQGETAIVALRASILRDSILKLAFTGQGAFRT
jgi:hypothetical protein